MLVSRAERRELDSLSLVQKRASFLQVSSETVCFLQRKLLPVIICLSHGLSCSKKRFHARFLPGPPSSEAKASGQGKQAASRQAAGSPGRQQQAGQAEDKAGRQTSRQAGRQTSRQAGRQAGRRHTSLLAQAGTHASRQAGSFDGKEKQGRPQRKPSILASRTNLGAKDVKSCGRKIHCLGASRQGAHESATWRRQARRQAGRQAGVQAGVQAGRQAGSFDGKEKQGRPQRKPSILA